MSYFLAFFAFFAFFVMLASYAPKSASRDLIRADNPD